MSASSFVYKNTKNALILWDEERLLAVPPNLMKSDMIAKFRSSWFRDNGRMPVNLESLESCSDRKRLTVGF
jgi:hypothetical protein